MYRVMGAMLLLAFVVNAESRGYGVERRTAASRPPIGRVPNDTAKNRTDLGKNGSDVNQPTKPRSDTPSSPKNPSDKSPDRNSDPSTSRGNSNGDPQSRGRPCIGYPDRQCL